MLFGTCRFGSRCSGIDLRVSREKATDGRSSRRAARPSSFGWSRRVCDPPSSRLKLGPHAALEPDLRPAQGCVSFSPHHDSANTNRSLDHYYVVRREPRKSILESWPKPFVHLSRGTLQNRTPLASGRKNGPPIITDRGRNFSKAAGSR